jgi:hypothetical protein
MPKTNMPIADNPNKNGAIKCVTPIDKNKITVNQFNFSTVSILTPSNINIKNRV